MVFPELGGSVFAADSLEDLLPTRMLGLESSEEMLRECIVWGNVESWKVWHGTHFVRS